MEKICYLAFKKEINENAIPHKRIASDKTISTDIRDGMVFTARQVFDIIICLKNGEIPNDNYTFNEITLWQACRNILLDDKEFIKEMKD